MSASEIALPPAETGVWLKSKRFVGRYVQKFNAFAVNHRILAYLLVDGVLLYGASFVLLNLEISLWGQNDQYAPYYQSVPFAALGYYANKYLTFGDKKNELNAVLTPLLWWVFKVAQFLANHSLYGSLVAKTDINYRYISLLTTAALGVISYAASRYLIFRSFKRNERTK